MRQFSVLSSRFSVAANYELRATSKQNLFFVELDCSKLAARSPQLLRQPRQTLRQHLRKPCPIVHDFPFGAAVLFFDVAVVEIVLVE